MTSGNPGMGFGVNRLVGGVCFSLGLVLVVVGGAELFTGNNLLAMAWASGSISTRDLLQHWGLAYQGNVVGCLLTVLLVMGTNPDFELCCSVSDRLHPPTEMRNLSDMCTGSS